MAEWHKCTGGIWCELYKLDLDDDFIKTMNGVFVVWSGKEQKVILNVGFGEISLELKRIKDNIAIRAFASHGVYVTWCKLPSVKIHGVARYLINQLDPKIQKKFSAGLPIHINLPWEVNDDDE